MSTWNGKSQGSLLGYQIVYYLMKYAGLSSAYFLLRFVAAYYLLFSTFSTKCQAYYFRMRLGHGYWQSIASMYKNYYLFAQTLTDRVYLIAGLKNKFTFNFDGEHYLTEMLALRKGAFLVSAHAGNWEIAGFLLYRLSVKINVVVYEAEHEDIKSFLDEVKGNTGINLITITKGSIDHVYKIHEAIQNNEIVCIHADRFVEGSNTTEIEFLGEKAEFPLGPFILATQLQAPVSFVFAMKESKQHYHLFASPPILPSVSQFSREDKQQSSRKLLEKYIHSLEKILQLYPYQWFNYYKFWKYSSIKS